MDSLVSNVANAIGVIIEFGLLVLAAALGAAILAGLFRVATQIDDAVINFAARILAVGAVLFIAGNSIMQSIVSYTSTLWGASSSYF